MTIAEQAASNCSVAHYQWPPGLPTKKTRVTLAGTTFNGTVIDAGPQVVVVKWDEPAPGAGLQNCPRKWLIPEGTEATNEPEKEKWQATAQRAASRQSDPLCRQACRPDQK